MITNKCIVGNPVTVADVERAEAMWGPDVGLIKGKTKRRKPVLPAQDTANVPDALLQKNREIDLCIDTLFVNRIPFLTSVSKKLTFRTADPLPNKTKEAHLDQLKKIFHFCLRHGAHVTRITADKEFDPVVTDMQTIFGTARNVVPTDSHVGEIESTNRVIQERAQATFHSLPFKAMPRLMIRTMIMECSRKLNFVPPKAGLSPFHSPREIPLGRTVNCNQECLCPMFSYMLGHESREHITTQRVLSMPSTSVLPRTVMTS